MSPAPPVADPRTDATAAGRAIRLRVRDERGRDAVLDLQAPSEAAAVRQASARGWQVVAVDAPAAARPAATGRFALVLFCQELVALLEAGLNLHEALQTLRAKERSPQGGAVLGRVLGALGEGRNFSDVLEGMPEHFPEVFVATVRASERTGDLASALSRYVAYELQFDAIRKKLVSASIYPALLLLLGTVVTLFLMGYVVPRFSLAYESTGRDLPWMSALLLRAGRGLAGHGAALGAMAVLAVLAATAVLRSPARRAVLLDAVLGLPGLARKAAEFRLARVYRALSLLLDAGIPLPRALRMVGGLLGREQQPRLDQARRAVEQGVPLSQALVAAGLADAVAESLMRVGERSGQMARMLERTARFHDDEFARWVDWASRLLEPLLMALIGLVIGGVVVLMYLPIFELAGALP